MSVEVSFEDSTNRLMKCIILRSGSSKVQLGKTCLVIFLPVALAVYGWLCGHYADTNVI